VSAQTHQAKVLDMAREGSSKLEARSSKQTQRNGAIGEKPFARRQRAVS
jgi:hypothetical protein